MSRQQHRRALRYSVVPPLYYREINLRAIAIAATAAWLPVFGVLLATLVVVPA